jgi:hypothetical protein
MDFFESQTTALIFASVEEKTRRAGPAGSV